MAVYELALPAIEDGRRELQPLLDLYAKCLETDNWPGYSPDVEVIDLPRWAPSLVNDKLEAAA